MACQEDRYPKNWAAYMCTPEKNWQAIAFASKLPLIPFGPQCSTIVAYYRHASTMGPLNLFLQAVCCNKINSHTQKAGATEGILLSG